MQQNSLVDQWLGLHALLPGRWLDLWFGGTKILQTARWPIKRKGERENERERKRRKVEVMEEGGRKEKAMY